MTAGVALVDARGPQGMRIHAIGDVHGRLDLLARMLDRIEAGIARDRPDDWRVVLLGDYVDRGPDSAGVLDLIAARVADDARFVALMGNHDQRLLAFLDDIFDWPNFEQFGGRETALSYGVDFGSGSGKDLARAHVALRDAMPTSHRRLLGSLALSATLGDFFFCHAGIRPGVALDKQAADDLIWIRKPFHDDERLHPKVIVHGHTPVARADIRANRVNLDTRAFDSGLLTALSIDGAEKSILTVEG